MIHLGDVGGVEVIDALVGHTQNDHAVESRLVFGNTDWDIESMTRYAAGLGVVVEHPAGRVKLGERVLAYTHGHDGDAVRAALEQEVDYLCHGHTHQQCDQMQGATRVINPGALFRAPAYSVAVLDTTADDLSFYPVPR